MALTARETEMMNRDIARMRRHATATDRMRAMDAADLAELALAQGERADRRAAREATMRAMDAA